MTATAERSAIFVWNGIKIDGRLYRASYWLKEDGTIILHAKDYARIPSIEGVITTNGSDIVTDYFETDRLTVAPGTEYYEQAKAGLARHDAHFDKQEAARKERREKQKEQADAAATALIEKMRVIAEVTEREATVLFLIYKGSKIVRFVRGTWEMRFAHYMKKETMHECLKRYGSLHGLSREA